MNVRMDVGGTKVGIGCGEKKKVVFLVLLLLVLAFGNIDKAEDRWR
jgi:hypothetical protein